jgi:hypothetical protein
LKWLAILAKKAKWLRACLKKIKKIK